MLSFAVILFWLVGSFVIFEEQHGKVVILITGLIIIFGIYARIRLKKQDKTY